MLLKTEKNWKTLLTPEDEQRLNGILEQIKSHRAAYLSADDVKLAQLWCAVVELSKENDALNARVKRLEYILSGLFARARTIENEPNKLARSLGRF